MGGYQARETLDQRFKHLAQRLLGDAQTTLKEWLPGGRVWGREFVCGSLHGEAGKSCKINLVNGRWADFATDERGGDLISLYAAIHKISQFEALNALDGTILPISKISSATKMIDCPNTEIPSKGPPAGAQPPHFFHSSLGEPKDVYEYRNRGGVLLYFVCRFMTPVGKTLRPMIFEEGRWRWKGWIGQRPLFNQQNFTSGLPYLVVEGEKAAAAAHSNVGTYFNVTTWHGGSHSWSKHDWNILTKDTVILWPDDDDPGRQCMELLGEYLRAQGCAVEVLPTSGHTAMDAADHFAPMSRKVG